MNMKDGMAISRKSLGLLPVAMISTYVGDKGLQNPSLVRGF